MLILNSLAFFFQLHKSRLYFSNDEFFPLKFNESFVNWRIVSMSPVQILKIKVLFTKIWLKIKVLFYFKSFSFVSSCINEDSYDLFSLKTLFLFPFHSVFHSVPFSVPFSVPRFSNTQHFLCKMDSTALPQLIPPHFQCISRCLKLFQHIQTARLPVDNDLVA